MKGKHEEFLKNFFNGIINSDGEEFPAKVSGYCCVYAPYYICMMECDDGDYLDFCLRTIQDSIG